MEETVQLELKNIVKNYGTYRAVDHIDLQIKKGEIVSLLGASGCGKTTTLKMVAGLISPTAGSIKIANEEVTDLAPYDREISMVFQNYALFPNMNIYENVVYGLKNRNMYDKKTWKHKVEEMLHIVQLVGQEGKYPRQLSGGQQQRVSLARALATKPKIMLFDEPLSNLDAKLKLQMRMEIRRLLKSLHITALYVTHDQEEALSISDRIAVMNKGKIEQIDSPCNIYNYPLTTFVANFIGQANIVKGELQVSDGEYYLHSEGGVVIKCSPSQGYIDADHSAVHVMLRPENIFFTNDELSINSIKGQIQEEIFLGHSIRYKVKLVNGETVVAMVHPRHKIPDGVKDVFANFDSTKTILVN